MHEAVNESLKNNPASIILAIYGFFVNFIIFIVANQT